MNSKNNYFGRESSAIAAEKNPYGHESPEWQLFENMKSSELAAAAAGAEAQRALEKGAAARSKALAYRAALEKLGMVPQPQSAVDEGPA
jgi:hypothetical protein